MARGSGREDSFDCIFLADDRFYLEGYREGFEAGSRRGKLEGRRHGASHGAKFSTEISFYYGFAISWKCFLQKDVDAKSRKRVKALETFLMLIQMSSHEDAQNKNLQHNVERVRAKFRQKVESVHLDTKFNVRSLSSLI
ncbi:protein LTO1 homolog isoform X2 [Lampris incognitus]|uniref:protein LTO1 homolog isoform X2 n=1 Tax=Lampris incognitus TaxID=2546036 RepID=UPI0024B5F95F|nr:protein LTO1 homolog isoform X2 [Lampris incognitus]